MQISFCKSIIQWLRLIIGLIDESFQLVLGLRNAVGVSDLWADFCLEEKPYSCDTCGKKFRYKDNLHSHWREHTQAREVITYVFQVFAACVVPSDGHDWAILEMYPAT